MSFSSYQSIHFKKKKNLIRTKCSLRSGEGAGTCTVNLDDPSQWPGSNPPILLDEVESVGMLRSYNLTLQSGDFILPQGDEASRQFVLNEDQIFILGCSGSEFLSDGSSTMKTGLCGSGGLLVEDSDVGNSLADFQCKHQPYDEANKIGEMMYKNQRLHSIHATAYSIHATAYMLQHTAYMLQHTASFNLGFRLSRPFVLWFQ